jgi:hypothetical protein
LGLKKQYIAAVSLSEILEIRLGGLLSLWRIEEIIHSSCFLISNPPIFVED